ncbi:hypothetical protein PENTCL1PPCAC_14886, partial [Pristionchus entomophagus]
AEDCNILFFKEIAVWSYEDTPCNNFYSFCINFILSVFAYVCIVVLDFIAVLALRKAYDMTQWSQHFIRKRRMEVGFFVQ